MTNIHAVGIDNVQAAADAVQHLILLGHQRIAHICGPLDLPAGVQRKRGYQQALAKHDIPVDESIIVQGDFRKDGGYEAARHLLTSPRPPTAIFAANDATSLGAWKAARELGLAVPGDLALVGFDDIELLELAEIPLTTVRQPLYQMGYLAMQMLISLIEADGPLGGLRHVTLPTELVIRGSCGHQPLLPTSQETSRKGGMPAFTLQ